MARRNSETNSAARPVNENLLGVVASTYLQNRRARREGVIMVTMKWGREAKYSKQRHRAYYKCVVAMMRL